MLDVVWGCRWMVVFPQDGDDHRTVPDADGPAVAGRYRLGRSLGVGGMGRVWLAHDELLRREVAVKEVVLPFGMSDDEREELRLRTLREARAAARLSHPNVVQIYDVIHGEQQPWIVMEYVAARSLLQVVEEHGPLPGEQVALIGLAILSALAAANRAGVLHRDIKPSNVLIAHDGRVVLTDFGSAVLDDTDGTITKTGLVLGSPQYIAPERARTGISTPESDLWSLGATLYTAVEGRSPFHRPTVTATLIAVATERPDPIRRGTALKPVISGLLKKNPAARMSAFDTERRLRRVAGLESKATRPVPSRTQPDDPARVETNSLISVPVPPINVVTGYARKEPPAVPATGRRRRLRLAVAAIAALAVLALGSLTIAAQAQNRTPGARGAATTGPTTGPTMSASGVDGTGGARAANPLAAPPRGQLLPANLTWWYDQDGFIVPMPVGWRTLREGPKGIFFGEPGGPRTLRVHAWDQLAPDLVVALTREEARANLRNYHRLRIQVLPDGRGAEWEYTFTDTTGDLHGLERGFVANGQAYLIQWRIPVSAWLGSLTDYAAIVNGFHPPTLASKNHS